MSGHGLSRSLRLWLNDKDVEGESSNQDQPPAEGIPTVSVRTTGVGKWGISPQEPRSGFQGVLRLAGAVNRHLHGERSVILEFMQLPV